MLTAVSMTTHLTLHCNAAGWYARLTPSAEYINSSSAHGCETIPLYKQAKR